MKRMTPDQSLLMKLDGRIQNTTAAGINADCVSRSFCPKLSIAEDPVCGSAHCQIAAYWSDIFGKRTIKAFQASKRGGCLQCELLDDGRINLKPAKLNTCRHGRPEKAADLKNLLFFSSGPGDSCDSPCILS